MFTLPSRFAFFALFFSLIGLLLGAIIFGQGARANEPGASNWDENDHVAMRLVAATTAVGQGDEVRAALEFQLKKGWKIYWRNPGDAGLPPMPKWDASENISGVETEWPVPERFSIFGFETFGYEDAVLLPLKVSLEEAGKATTLGGIVDYLVCEEVCIPYRASVSLDLPAGEATPSRFVHEIDRYRARVPVVQNAESATQVAGLSLIGLASEGGDGDSTLIVEIASDRPLATPDVMIEGPVGAAFSKPQMVLSETGDAARLTMTATGIDVAALDTAELTLTITDGNRGVETTTRIAAFEPAGKDLPNIPSLADGDRSNLVIILFFALLGGLILNLMPCVLPVLSLKVISVVSKGGQGKAHVRAGFLATAAGIMTAFMALAVAVIAVKAGGMTVGWGVQFQQPVFLAFMVAMLTLFACNLVGLFEFRLPAFIADRAAVLGKGSGLIGDFLTGMFATLLATPCTAPFLGTAVGFALSRGTGEILAVFLTLGIGLALPYLAVAAFPAVAGFLPKPGSWMRWLKYTMAAALAGTGIWLLSVLAALIGHQNAGAVGFLAVIAALVLATRHVDGSRMGRIAWPLSAMLAILTVALPLTFDPLETTQAVKTQDDGIAWEVFDEAVIREHVAAGRSVLVDVTADWCVTCQWNKKAVIDRGAVAKWLGGAKVVAMRADWTKPNPVIAAYLNRHGRYGIPFNIIYGPEVPSGIPLPELLSVTDVMQAAATASGDSTLIAAQ